MNNCIYYLNLPLLLLLRLKFLIFYHICKFHESSFMSLANYSVGVLVLRFDLYEIFI